MAIQVVMMGTPAGDITAFIQLKSAVALGGPLPALYASKRLLDAQPYVTGELAEQGLLQEQGFFFQHEKEPKCGATCGGACTWQCMLAARPCRPLWEANIKCGAG